MLSKWFKKTQYINDTFIEMSRIVKVFHTPAGEFPALKGINANFHKGEFVSVVGKSGSGKSTLVNMLAGIDHPTSGEVRIGDTYVHKLNESQMSRWRGRNLGIVFQFYQLLPMLSLLENVMLPMDFCNMYAPLEREKRALELLDMVGLVDVAHKMPAAVSGGQQQSAAIARALANDPPLIVADEPTGNLDSRAADSIFRVFEELSAQGKTIIMVTHDNSLADRAARKVMLADGEMIDETVAKTLPLLTHRQMLKATKKLEPRRFEAGETIIQQGSHNNRFYMIAEGHTEIHLEQKERSGVVAQLGPGQFFGEVELLQVSARAVASVKAALHSAVKVLTLDRIAFDELMNEAYAMRQALAQVVQERLNQNAMFQGRGIGYVQASLA
jgi:ABC-type lipoprotein export system ATPase subunit